MKTVTVLVGRLRAGSSAIGTAAAQGHLRSMLPILDAVVFGQPEVYFHTRPGLIDADHEITDDQTRAFLEGWVAKFDAFVERVALPKAA